MLTPQERINAANGDALDTPCSANALTRYDHFIAELTALTRRYGIVVSSVGGVYLYESVDECLNVGYIADHSSGDLLPYWPET